MNQVSVASVLQLSSNRCPPILSTQKGTCDSTIFSAPSTLHHQGKQATHQNANGLAYYFFVQLKGFVRLEKETSLPQLF
jgi:hypothetical protein